MGFETDDDRTVPRRSSSRFRKRDVGSCLLLIFMALSQLHLMLENNLRDLNVIKAQIAAVDGLDENKILKSTVRGLDTLEAQVEAQDQLEAQTIGYKRDVAHLSYRTLEYEFPVDRFERLQQQGKSVVAAILSTADNRVRRDSIRGTWAYNRSDVFFLVAGEHTHALREEMLSENDIFWVDEKEHYLGITWKVLGFFVAFHKHCSSFQHIVKADDDSFVNMGAIERYFRQTDNAKKQYVGCCMNQPHNERALLEEFYPRYASGGGYIVSNEFVSCLAQVAPRWVNLAIEDANTGLIARECGVTCEQDEGMIFPWRGPENVLPTNSSHIWIQHYVKEAEEMEFLHARSCGNTSADPISCTKYQHSTLDTDDHGFENSTTLD